MIETARGGILLKGMGVTSNDVSVVTNVTADHLGLQGIDTVDQLAEVKARGPADHEERTVGPCSTATTHGSSRCAQEHARPGRGCSRATPTPRRCARCSPAHGRATTVLDGWTRRSPSRAWPRPRSSRWQTSR